MNETRRGRPPAEADKEKFKEKVQLVDARKITAQEAAQELGISRMTFFRRKKEE